MNRFVISNYQMTHIRVKKRSWVVFSHACQILRNWGMCTIKFCQTWHKARRCYTGKPSHFKFKTTMSITNRVSSVRDIRCLQGIQGSVVVWDGPYCRSLGAEAIAAADPISRWFCRLYRVHMETVDFGSLGEAFTALERCGLILSLYDTALGPICWMAATTKGSKISYR